MWLYDGYARHDPYTIEMSTDALDGTALTAVNPYGEPTAVVILSHDAMQAIETKEDVIEFFTLSLMDWLEESLKTGSDVIVRSYGLEESQAAFQSAFPNYDPPWETGGVIIRSSGSI